MSDTIEQLLATFATILTKLNDEKKMLNEDKKQIENKIQTIDNNCALLVEQVVSGISSNKSAIPAPVVIQAKKEELISNEPVVESVISKVEAIPAPVVIQDKKEELISNEPVAPAPVPVPVPVVKTPEEKLMDVWSKYFEHNYIIPYGKTYHVYVSRDNWKMTPYKSGYNYQKDGHIDERWKHTGCLTNLVKDIKQAVPEKYSALTIEKLGGWFDIKYIGAYAQHLGIGYFQFKTELKEIFPFLTVPYSSSGSVEFPGLSKYVYDSKPKFIYTE
jgi:hypothetical protein